MALNPRGRDVTARFVPFGPIYSNTFMELAIQVAYSFGDQKIIDDIQRFADDERGLDGRIDFSRDRAQRAFGKVAQTHKLYEYIIEKMKMYRKVGRIEADILHSSLVKTLPRLVKYTNERVRSPPRIHSPERKRSPPRARSPPRKRSPPPPNPRTATRRREELPRDRSLSPPPAKRSKKAETRDDDDDKEVKNTNDRHEDRNNDSNEQSDGDE